MRLQLLAVAALAAACASPTRFTRPDELEALAREPLPQSPPGLPLRDVASWSLDGELPERVEHVPHTPETGPFAWLLAHAAVEQGLVPSVDLTCIARQQVRFQLENAGAPGTLLQRFIEARCGTPSPRVVLSSVSGQVPQTLPDSELVERWSADLARHLAAIPRGAWVGLALARSKHEARITLAWAFDEAQLEPVSMVPEGDVVRIRGVLGHDVDELFGSVNQGDFGAVDCVRNTTVALPRFELACPVHAGDGSAWLGVWVRDEGRFLGHTVFETLVWPSRAPTATYLRPARAMLRDGTAEAFLETLNGLRTQLGRAPLTLAARQSEQVAAFVPRYLAAARAQDTNKADRIALGLIAGWRVGTPVTQGQFSASTVPIDAAKELLALMLERPGGRRQLLAKDARVLAFGAAESDGVLDAVVCTYSIVEETSLSAERVREVLAQLNAERTKRGLAKAQGLQLPVPIVPTAAEDLRAGKSAPKDALERIMEEAARLVRRPVKGYVIRTSSLDALRWPEALLGPGSPQVLVMLASWKDPELPWSSYCVMVVSFEGAGTTQA